ncbi:hypothetical protein Tco_0289944 [Tanacetum coccineum]
MLLMRKLISFVRSSMTPPPVLKCGCATTIIDDVHFCSRTRADTRQVPLVILGDLAYMRGQPRYCKPSHPVGTDSSQIRVFRVDKMLTQRLFTRYTFLNGIMDYEQLFVEFNVGSARQLCLGSEVRLRLEHELRGRKKFEDRCAMQAGWLKEKDAEIAMLIEIMPKNIINIF